jgi:hypothetical protein
MKTTVRWIDVSKHVAAGDQPVVGVEREHSAKGVDVSSGASINRSKPRTGTYWTTRHPLVAETEDMEWSMTRRDQYVMVPIHAYLTHNRSKPDILVTAIEIGFRAALSYCQKVRKPIEEIILLVGTQVDDLAPERPNFRCYVAIAIKENSDPS